jgi:alkylation response protein AidB-like acyl-CoA dehydrogenase
MAAPTASTILSDGMLERFRARAPGYDRENRFFQEDFDELREAGYLAIAVPRELGGRGFTFAECMREQRRLAYYAHATALAMNMHTYWVGVAADLWRAGDRSLEWMLRGAVNGDVFGPATPSGEMTSPCSCPPRRPSVSRAATASPATSPSGA